MNRQTLNQEPRTNSYNLRIFLLLFIITTAVGLISIRLFNLQVLSHAYYSNLAANQHAISTSITPTRGQIFLSGQSGNPVLVATNISKNMVYAVPKEITDKPATAFKLSQILDMTQAEIAAKIAGSGNFAVVKKQIEDNVSAKLKELKLKGIYMQAQDLRFYPETDLASQVVGFVGYKGSDRLGQYGIEGKYEKNLAGTKGSLDAETDPTGRWIATSSRSFVPATDGDDIYLTIDPVIQFKAQEVLKDTISKHGADSGSVIVINPKTGAVMAMASEPGFDPNNYGKVKDPSVFANKVISADYEPGSVFKAITLAAALNEKKITPQTTYEDKGVIQIGDKQIKNSDPKPLGVQNMIQVLDQSLNTGAVFAQQQIGNDTFKNYVERFGFGQLVNLDLPGQVKGDLGNLNKKGDVFFATTSFGQGITVTPLQLVQAYSAIANGGKMETPYLVDKIVHPSGDTEQPRPQSSRQVIDPQTAAALSGMLVDVVENGHGKKAGVAGYYIAGKTGTAQVPYKNKSGYDPNTNIGSFIGYGPEDNPQFLALVRIDNPKDVKFAESTAAPAFGEIAKFILNYLQVQPSR